MLRKHFIFSILIIFLQNSHAFAASLAERVMTDEPVCRNIKALFSLCLIDDIAVAKTDPMVFYLGTNNDLAFFRMDEGVGSVLEQQYSGLKPEEMMQQYLSKFEGYKNHKTLNNTQSEDVISFTFGTMAEGDIFPSPIITSILKYNDKFLSVTTKFPNAFMQEADAKINDAKLQSHESLVNSIQPPQ